MVAIEITENGVEEDPLSRVSVHVAAELFPLMSGAEFDDLVADIAEHGQRDPVVMTPDGQLLDGRNRWRACAKAGVRPVTRVETAEPWAFVISTNVHRRHLTESQRAMIAARIAERRRGSQPEDQINPPIGEPTSLPPTRREAAQLLNVGTTSIDRARKIITQGTPQLQKAVENGAIKVWPAARMVEELTPQEQDEAVKQITDEPAPAKPAPCPKPNTPTPPRPRNQRVGGRGKQYTRSEVVPRTAVAEFAATLTGMAMGLQNASAVEDTITPGEAARYAAEITKGVVSLRKLINMLKERTAREQ